MTRQHFWLSLLALLLAVVAPRPAASQVGTTTDIITVTGTGLDSQPLAGAVVQATSLETQVSRQHVTDSRGRFTIVFPDGGGRYELTARFIGLAPVQITVARQTDEDRLEANIRMGLLAVGLEPVTVTALQGGRPDRAGPGGTERSLNQEQLTRLPIDATNLNTMATLVPGVVGIAATDSTATAFSVAGQRPTANNVTLDGVSFGSGSLPQDAIRSTRVITSTYDVARGQFSGGLVSAARFLGLARSSGAPLTVPGLPNDRTGDNTLALVRLDWQVSDAHTLMLRFDGRWDSQEPTRVSSLALPATGGTRSERGGGVMASLTSHFGGNFINELRGYVAAIRRDAHPYLAVPAALVNVASDLSDGRQAVATLAFGGNNGLPQRVDNRTVEATEDLSWLPGRTAHRVKLGADLNR